MENRSGKPGVPWLIVVPKFFLPAESYGGGVQALFVQSLRGALEVLLPRRQIELVFVDIPYDGRSNCLRVSAAKTAKALCRVANENNARAVIISWDAEAEKTPEPTAVANLLGRMTKVDQFPDLLSIELDLGRALAEAPDDSESLPVLAVSAVRGYDEEGLLMH